MTVEKLVESYKKMHPNGHFFDKRTLLFFGEKLSEMEITGRKIVETSTGEKHDCWVLKKYSRTYPTGPIWTTAYFDVETFDDVISKED